MNPSNKMHWLCMFPVLPKQTLAVVSLCISFNCPIKGSSTPIPDNMDQSLKRLTVSKAIVGSINARWMGVPLPLVYLAVKKYKFRDCSTIRKPLWNHIAHHSG